MIIFGTRGITSVQQRGSFHCPACGAGAPFEKKDVRRWFTLFFIPCIPLHKAADYLECKRCGGAFKPEVLTWNGTVPGQVPPPIPQAEEIHQLRPSVHPVTGMPLPPPLAPPSLGPGTVVSYQANGLATASMVLGILGLLTAVLICPAFIFVPLSLLFGFIALGKVRKGNGLVGGKTAARVGIVCSLVALLLVSGAYLRARNHKPAPVDKAESRRDAAELKISNSSSIIAFGNTAEARNLAEEYVTLLKSLHSLSFTDKDGKPKEGRYVVHCELQEGKCAFLVHVPDYRQFEKEAKKSLEKLAWTTAQMVVESENTRPKGSPLGVALKGKVMFGSVMTGELGSAEPLANSKSESDMDHFFKEPEPKVEPPTATESAPEEDIAEEVEEVE